MVGEVRSIERWGREFTLDSMDENPTWYLFESFFGEYDLVGAITKRDGAFRVECYWKPPPRNSARCEDLDEAVDRLIDLTWRVA